MKRSGKILVLNCGSSSIKYKLFSAGFDLLLSGAIKKIGRKGTKHTHTKGGADFEKRVNVGKYKKGIELVINTLRDKKWGSIEDFSEVSVVGHRVVHGGKMDKAVVASKDVLNHLKEFELLAPLHNPYNLLGVKEIKRKMPKVPQVMVFDTQFHKTMPAKAYMYGLPYDFLTKYNVRKYGFHGTSHKYIAQRAGEMLGKRKPNLITCHLGAGASITAVKKGKSVDTSMGMTPLEGIMMATRTGDIDPSVMQYLVKKYDFEYDEIYDIMNHKSGLLGISGESIDPRAINRKAKKGNKRCELALEMFCYRVAKYIGAYAVALGNVDAIVFTAGIGAGSDFTRERICSYLSILDVRLSRLRNSKAIDKEMKINTPKSRVKVFVIPTNEELMIAKEAKKVAESNKSK